MRKGLYMFYHILNIKIMFNDNNKMPRTQYIILDEIILKYQFKKV
jgi:hypothetical protein